MIRILMAVILMSGFLASVTQGQPVTLGPVAPFGDQYLEFLVERCDALVGAVYNAELSVMDDELSRARGFLDDAVYVLSADGRGVSNPPRGMEVAVVGAITKVATDTRKAEAPEILKAYGVKEISFLIETRRQVQQLLALADTLVLAGDEEFSRQSVEISAQTEKACNRLDVSLINLQGLYGDWVR
jgi:hypothetical protein